VLRSRVSQRLILSAALASALAWLKKMSAIHLTTHVHYAERQRTCRVARHLPIAIGRTAACAGRLSRTARIIHVGTPTSSPADVPKGHGAQHDSNVRILAGAVAGHEREGCRCRSRGRWTSSGLSVHVPKTDLWRERHGASSSVSPARVRARKFLDKTVLAVRRHWKPALKPTPSFSWASEMSSLKRS
jgi:hypothetical protein